MNYELKKKLTHKTKIERYLIHDNFCGFMEEIDKHGKPIKVFQNANEVERWYYIKNMFAVTVFINDKLNEFGLTVQKPFFID